MTSRNLTQPTEDTCPWSLLKTTICSNAARDTAVSSTGNLAWSIRRIRRADPLTQFRARRRSEEASGIEKCLDLDLIWGTQNIEGRPSSYANDGTKYRETLSSQFGTQDGIRESAELTPGFQYR